MLIFLRQANGNGFQINVEPNCSIEQLYQCVKDYETEIQQKYQIFFKGQMIEPSLRTLGELNIKENDIIHLRKIGQNGVKQETLNLNIFYNSETYSIRIGNQECVSKLKHKVYEVTRVYPKQQYLVYRGKKLHDNSTLVGQNIENDALISLISVERKECALKHYDSLPYDEKQLLESISSVKLKRTASLASKVTKATLFRSDSIGSKLTDEHASPQVQVKNMRAYIDLSASVQSELDLYKLAYGHLFQQQNQEQQIFPPKSKPLLMNSLKLQQFRLNRQFVFPHSKIHQNDEEEIQQDENSSKERSQSLYQKLKLDESSLFDSMQFAGQTQKKPNKDHLLIDDQMDF